MGCNDVEAGGSDAHDNRPRNLTIEEAAVFAWNDILVPVDWHLPVGWNISQGGLAIQPLPRNADLEAMIAQRIRVLPPHEATDWS
jgi:hypothetical protein